MFSNKQILQKILMKVLILSCNTGEGHNSSAKALNSFMEKRGVGSVVADVLSFAGGTISTRVSQAYNSSIKGTLFGNLYKIGDFVSNNVNCFKSPVYYANKLYSHKLYNYIVCNEFDAVVAVHLFAAEALTAIRRKEGFGVPTLFVMTDYTCIPFLKETELDGYAIAHEELRDEFVSAGIPENKIIVAGIPVNGADISISKGEARERINSIFNWETENKNGLWFLIMGGSMGYGNMERLIEELCKRSASEDCIICVCGRNKDSRKKITEYYTDLKKVKVIGYTDNIPLLMKASDILFSKPGGITSTEAILNNIPLVHTAPIPGFEYRNAIFFHNRSMSYYTADIEKQATVAVRLCNDSAYRSRMLDAQRMNSNSNSCGIITDYIIRMTKRYVPAN